MGLIAAGSPRDNRSGLFRAFSGEVDTGSPKDKCDHAKRKRAKPDSIKTGFALAHSQRPPTLSAASARSNVTGWFVTIL